MEAWAWLLAYVLGFGLLQLFLYRYFRGEGGPTDGTPSGLAEGAAPATSDGGTAADREGVHCEHCGAHNDREPNFRFCRECASPLQ